MRRREKKDAKKRKQSLKKGYSRIKEKIKEIRQKFSNAVTLGTPSGSGKFELEFYDLMVQIWGGAPATEPLLFGVTTAEEEVQRPSGHGEEEEDSGFLEESLATNIDRPTCSSTPIPREIFKHSGQKRKETEGAVPSLIDNKRKNMERQLSAGQRDKILMQDSKEEKEFRNNLAKAMQESNALFAESIKAMSSSMVVLAQSLQKSTEMMSREQIPPQFLNPQFPNQYQCF